MTENELRENNKPTNLTIDTTITFYESELQKDTIGSNNISYEIYYSTKDGLIKVYEICAFGDRALVGTFSDRRNRGITLQEMLENIQQLSDMTYKEFTELVLNKGGCKI